MRITNYQKAHLNKIAILWDAVWLSVTCLLFLTLNLPLSHQVTKVARHYTSQLNGSVHSWKLRMSKQINATMSNDNCLYVLVAAAPGTGQLKQQVVWGMGK